MIPIRRKCCQPHSRNGMLFYSSPSAVPSLHEMFKLSIVQFQAGEVGDEVNQVDSLLDILLLSTCVIRV